MVNDAGKLSTTLFQKAWCCSQSWQSPLTKYSHRFEKDTFSSFSGCVTMYLPRKTKRLGNNGSYNSQFFPLLPTRHIASFDSNSSPTTLSLSTFQFDCNQQTVMRKQKSKVYQLFFTSFIAYDMNKYFN